MQYYWEALRKKEEMDALLTSIPKASMVPIKMDSVENPKDRFQAITVEGRIVGVVSDRYKLVQHEEAFRPIIDGLNAVAEDYRASISKKSDYSKAFLNVVTKLEAKDGVELGFKAANSLDGSMAVKYAFISQTKKSEIEVTGYRRYIEIVGYRQTCSNGMTIRVPLDQAEFTRVENRTEKVANLIDADFIEEKERVRVVTLLETYGNIVHIGKPEEKLKAVRYIVEALSLLKEPVAKLITTAQDHKLGQEEAKQLIAKWIGKRMAERVEEKFAEEEQTLWGLYNSLTNIATHDAISNATKNGLMDSAATMLAAEAIAVRAKK